MDPNKIESINKMNTYFDTSDNDEVINNNNEHSQSVKIMKKMNQMKKMILMMRMMKHLNLTQKIGLFEIQMER